MAFGCENSTSVTVGKFRDRFGAKWEQTQETDEEEERSDNGTETGSDISPSITVPAPPALLSLCPAAATIGFIWDGDGVPVITN